VSDPKDRSFLPRLWRKRKDAVTTRPPSQYDQIRAARRLRRADEEFLAHRRRAPWVIAGLLVWEAFGKASPSMGMPAKRGWWIGLVVAGVVVAVGEWWQRRHYEIDGDELD